ncbi:cytochrome c biogenesis protein ResB [Intrasporangium sp.]|uniref:cytochrome c biogenesis protein ResB n=1 Tax=Intrasporangium sp. TaxID=1925024 RepID=UPI0032214F36
MTSTDTTTPRRAAPSPQLPPLGFVGMLRWAWRQLTSMRTALFLLLLISVAAVPGSVFPQRNIDPGRVADYLARHRSSGPWLDRLGFFDVFSSPWFSAIYLLLFVSLIGCIVPRAKVHLRSLRSRPPRAPARPERLEHHAALTTPAAPEAVLAAARQVLAARRFRVHSHDDASVSAESGYLRETGNLVFHVALTGIIVGMAVGHLFGWRGDVIVPEGQKFASSISTYNTFSPGPWVNPARIPSFVLTVDRLQADFIDTPGPTFGQPRDFIAHTQVRPDPGAPAVPAQISVNHPLSVEGADVFLLGNGYAPVITVRDGAGNVLYHEATPFLPQDATYRSVGVVKVSALPVPKQLGISGFFLPTAEPTFANGPASLFPDALDPELALSVWEGSLFPGGLPQSVYTLNTEAMKQVTKDDGSPVLVRIKPGQTYQLPGDRGSITFDSVKRFAGLSVRHDPGELVALVSAILTTAGLILALTIKRRRVFVRVRQADGPDGRAATVVSIGGLSKDSDAGLDAVIQAVHDQLAERTSAP